MLSQPSNEYMMDLEKEAKILQRALGGDARAFAVLVEAHYDRVYGCAYRFCGTREDAEDVAQEVFHNHHSQEIPL